MTGHLPPDMLAILADATKLRKAGEASSTAGLPVAQSVVIDAILIEAAALVIDANAVEPVRAEIRELLSNVVRNFVAKRVPAGSPHHFRVAAERFGIVAAIGELAIKFGALPWDTGNVYRAAGEMFAAWSTPDAVDLPGVPAIPSLSAPFKTGTDSAARSEVTEIDAPLAEQPAAAPIQATPGDEATLANVLDRMDRPAALTVAQVIEAAATDNAAEVHAFLTDRGSRRKIAGKFAEAGYERITSPSAADGLWKVGPARVAIYARADLPDADRLAAAQAIVETASRPISDQKSQKPANPSIGKEIIP